jgi:hypothetical protein
MSILPVTLVQTAYLVPNLEAGCAALNRAFGWGPFLGGTEGVLADHTYRGAPAEPIRIRGVFVQTGEINVEVIEVVSDAPLVLPSMSITNNGRQASVAKRAIASLRCVGCTVEDRATSFSRQ